MTDVAPIFSQAASLEIMDGAACAFLAAAAACRARQFGANMAGSITLACIAALLAPIIRESFLHGYQGGRMVLAAMPDDAFIGALAGTIAPMIMPKKSRMAFFWLDAIGIGLSTSLAAALSVGEIGLVGALAIAVATSLAPGLCRDVAMGDIAMFVERNWYAAAAAIGALCSLAFLVFAAFNQNLPVFKGITLEVAVAIGLLATVSLRFWKDRQQVE